jgi:hypothetical protein
LLSTPRSCDGKQLTKSLILSSVNAAQSMGESLKMSTKWCARGTRAWVSAVHKRE